MNQNQLSGAIGHRQLSVDGDSDINNAINKAGQGMLYAHRGMTTGAPTPNALTEYHAWLSNVGRMSSMLQEQLRDAEARCKMAAAEVEQCRAALLMIEAVQQGARAEQVAR